MFLRQRSSYKVLSCVLQNKINCGSFVSGFGFDKRGREIVTEERPTFSTSLKPLCCKFNHADYLSVILILAEANANQYEELILPRKSLTALESCSRGASDKV